MSVDPSSIARPAIGKNMKLMVSATGVTGTTECLRVSDLTLNLSCDIAEARDRGSAWVRRAVGARDGSITGTMLWDPTDPGFAIMATAFFSFQPIGVTIQDGGATVFTGIAPSQTLSGSFVIGDFTRPEPDTDTVVANFTLYPASVPVFTFLGAGT